jgi:hypothetical protein
LTIAGGANPRILSEDASLAGPANLEITALNTIFTGSSGSAIKIYADDGEVASDGNLQIWSNVVGNTQYSWTFDTTGNLTLPGNSFAVNYANGNSVNPVTKFADSWSVPPGTSNVSFTVDGGNTYTMWVNGNIPNGIVVWNATVTLTNTNVPVIGTQYAWYYETGNALVLNSVPSQIIGTAGAISNAAPVVGNTNVFTFNITNNSGNTASVDYGWTKIS